MSATSTSLFGGGSASAVPPGPKLPAKQPHQKRVKAAYFYTAVTVALIFLGGCIGLIVYITQPKTEADIGNQTLAVAQKGQISVSAKLDMTASVSVSGVKQYSLNIQLSQLNSEPWQLENRIIDVTQPTIQITTDLSKVSGLLAAPATLTATWSIYNDAGSSFVTRSASQPIQLG